MKLANFIDRIKENTYSKTAAAFVNGDGRHVGFDEFWSLTRKTVGFLKGKELQGHSHIMVCLPASSDYVAVEMGIWLSGHIVIPVGNHFPSRRLESIRSLCQSPLMIDQYVLEEIHKSETSELYADSNDDDTAAVFFTSGSTGEPKGVCHSFRSLEYCLDCPTTAKVLSGAGSFATIAPMYFIACIFVYSNLYYGNSTCFLDENALSDIRLASSVLMRNEVRKLFATPSFFAQMDLSRTGIEKAILAGEAYSGGGEILNNLEVYSAYGLTETAGAALAGRVMAGSPAGYLGFPGKDITCEVMDAEGRPVPDGEEGELCLKGCFTSGYLNDPEQTKALFKGGWLHTGDIVRRQSDGSYIYINRRDWMVKINGMRIEIGEVERAISSLDGIKQVAVKGFTTNNRSYICAYYVADTAIPEELIKRNLSELLPSYMIPSFLIQSDHLPVNENGKIDRKALKSPLEDGEKARESEYSAPANEKEEMLCKAMAAVLGIEKVGATDDFLSLGGDSIRVMKLQNLCSSLDVSAKKVFKYRNAREIASHCRDREVSTSPYPLREYYPLSQPCFLCLLLFFRL